MDRRAFLACAPLVFGLDRLFAREAGWKAAALARMKESGRFGLVVAVPDADPAQRRAGAALWSLTRSELQPVRRLLAECVLICATRPAAFGVPEGRSLALLSPDGRVLDAAGLDPAVLEDGERFVAAAETLLASEGRRDLRAAEIERGLSRGLRDALARLDAEDAAERARALEQVSAEADRIAPLLAKLARGAAAPEARARAGEALARLTEAAKEGEFGPRLPYGARLPKLVRAGCGGLIEEERNLDVPLIRCGKAAVNAEDVRLFLRFLAS